MCLCNAVVKCKRGEEWLLGGSSRCRNVAVHLFKSSPVECGWLPIIPYVRTDLVVRWWRSETGCSVIRKSAIPSSCCSCVEASPNTLGKTKRRLYLLNLCIHPSATCIYSTHMRSSHVRRPGTNWGVNSLAPGSTVVQVVGGVFFLVWPSWSRSQSSAPSRFGSLSLWPFEHLLCYCLFSVLARGFVLATTWSPIASSHRPITCPLGHHSPSMCVNRIVVCKHVPLLGTFIAVAACCKM